MLSCRSWSSNMWAYWCYFCKPDCFCSCYRWTEGILLLIEFSFMGILVSYAKWLCFKCYLVFYSAIWIHMSTLWISHYASNITKYWASYKADTVCCGPKVAAVSSPAHLLVHSCATNCIMRMLLGLHIIPENLIQFESDWIWFFFLFNLICESNSGIQQILCKDSLTKKHI